MRKRPRYKAILIPALIISLLVAIVLILWLREKVEKMENIKALNELAGEYVWLTLHIDQHSPGYVDAYFGPEKLQEQVKREGKIGLDSLHRRAIKLLNNLKENKDQSMRKKNLLTQAFSAEAFIRILKGEKLTLKKEAELLYNIVPERKDESLFEQGIKELDEILPGEGEVRDRLKKWEEKFELKDDQILPAMKLALEEARKRTREFIKVPEGEEVELKLVKDKAWSGYNWYLGDYKSRVEKNTDLPVKACYLMSLLTHEAYPGHHTDLTLKDSLFFRENGWVEYSVYPLFSPFGVISEGTADLAMRVIFDKEDLIQWHKKVFFPGIGLDQVDVELWFRIREASKKLRFVGNNALFLYYKDNVSQDSLSRYLQHYGLASEEEASQWIEFIKEYRFYGFTYAYGQEMIEKLLEKGDKKKIFKEILTQPVYPSLIREWLKN